MIILPSTTHPSDTRKSDKKPSSPSESPSAYYNLLLINHSTPRRNSESPARTPTHSHVAADKVPTTSRSNRSSTYVLPHSRYTASPTARNARSGSAESRPCIFARQAGLLRTGLRNRGQSAIRCGLMKRTIILGVGFILCGFFMNNKGTHSGRARHQGCLRQNGGWPNDLGVSQWYLYASGSPGLRQRED